MNAKVPILITFVILKVALPVVGAYVPSVSFVTTTTHAPAAMAVKVFPVIEQTAEELVLKATAPLPEPPTGFNAIVEPTVVVAGDPEMLSAACERKLEELKMKLTKDDETPA